NAVLAPISDKGYGRIRPNTKERDCAESDREIDGRCAVDHKKRAQRDEMSDQSRYGDDKSAFEEALKWDRLQTQLFIHHGVDPDVPIRCDGRNDIVQEFSLKALGRVNFPDFLALFIGFCFDVIGFASHFRFVKGAIRSKRRVRDRSHRDGLGDRGGKTSHNQNMGWSAGGNNPENNAKHVDQAVLSAENYVSQRIVGGGVVKLLRSPLATGHRCLDCISKWSCWIFIHL